MARIFFRFFTENNPVRGTGKTNNIPDVNKKSTEYVQHLYGDMYMEASSYRA